MKRPDGYLTISHLGKSSGRSFAVLEIVLIVAGIAGAVAAYGF